jgi:hypothetical protein
MSKIKCPACGSENILTERRLDGFHDCLECLYRWKIGESQPKQSVFDHITAFPEALAEDLVYEIGVMWMSTLITDTTFDTYEEAIAAGCTPCRGCLG